MISRQKKTKAPKHAIKRDSEDEPIEKLKKKLKGKANADNEFLGVSTNNTNEKKEGARSKRNVQRKNYAEVEEEQTDLDEEEVSEPDEVESEYEP